jgi:hypothetical protein
MKRTLFFFALLLIMLLLAPSALFAQGESAVPFLLISPNSRASSMGEAGVAIADDASAIYWNPAGLAFQDGGQASITHSKWLPQFNQSDLFYDFFTISNHFESVGGTFAASVTYLNLGEFIHTGSGSPEELGRFKSYEYAVTAGYGTKVSQSLGLGVNLRLIHSALSPIGQGQEQGTGIATSMSFDVGVLYRPMDLEIPLIGLGLGDRFSIGANLSNLGPKLTYIDAAQADPLPTNLRLGFGYQILKSQYNNITAIVDFNRLLVRRYAEVQDTVRDSNGGVVRVDFQAAHVDNLPKSLITAWGDNGLQKVTTGGGIEYWYGDPGLIALRVGYFYESPSFGGRKFLTFGAGLRYDIYGFDFSYISAPDVSPLANTLRFSLLIRWGGKES